MRRCRRAGASNDGLNTVVPYADRAYRAPLSAATTPIEARSHAGDSVPFRLAATGIAL